MNNNLPHLPPLEIKKVVSALSETIDWSLKSLGIPDTWKVTKGAGITVLVIDTGTPNHIDLKDATNISQCKSFVDGEDIYDYQGHGCVHPETYIHTNYCGIEQIETLYNRINLPEIYSEEYKGYIKDVSKLGLKTYSLNQKTGNCEIDNILLLHKTQIDGEIKEILLEGNLNYKLTPWHPVYTYTGKAHNKFEIVKKRADELLIGDRMIFNNGNEAGNLIKDYYKINGLKYRICTNCGYKHEFKKERKNKWQCKKCHKRLYEDRINTYFVTEELSHLIGLIITDGHVHNPKHKQYRVEITSMTDEILIKANENLKKIGFDGGYIRKKERGNCSRLIIDNKEFHTILLNLGVLYQLKTYNQKLPEFVGKSPHNVICAFLAGVIDGDGCIDKNTTKNRITSVSHNFVKELSCLFNSIGISSGYQINNDKIYNGGFTKKNSTNAKVYNITFSKLNNIIIDFLSHPLKKQKATNQLEKCVNKARNIKKINTLQYNGVFYDFTVEKNHTYLANGHFVSNTHCGGSIGARANGYGIIGGAPECNLVFYKALNKDGYGSPNSVTKALKEALLTKPDIISMSLGSPLPDEEQYKIIKELYNLNIPVICAAGNEGKEGTGWPANYKECISIGAYDKNKSIASFSSVGKVDFAFPGVDNYSCYLNNKYCLMSGTSMSTPVAASVVALLLAKHKKQEKETGKNDCKTVDQIIEHLKKYSIDVGITGKDEWYGNGIIDVTKLLLTPENIGTPIEIEPEPERTTWQIVKDWFWKTFRKPF